ncbi:Autoinducer 2 sensor kinase/phosphatase LuxQ [Roseovarius albus]|uniref:histidine kinase n=1 Tax=Roseovarius albus TaxID=1247867 RepID=A0A1X6Z3C3_9RHOB|nr:ATP-binding protein [Roseovarius albus]SLN37406.1 Autoinducer 2 sensor kinase/phosphatase LuxQ [Roseovarius albus]
MPKGLINFLTSLKSQIRLFSFLSVVFFTATIAMTAQVFFQIDKYRTTVNDNLRWSLTQMERDHLQFILALERVKSADTESILQAKLRYDILYSRVMSVSEGSTFKEAFTLSEPQEQLQRIVDTLDDAMPLIDAEKENFFANVTTLLLLFDRLTPLMRDLSLDSIKAEAKNVAQERTILASRLRQLAVLSLLLLSGLLALLYFLWLSALSHRQKSKGNLITLNHLQTILDTSLDAVLVVNKDGTLLESNLAATELLDLTDKNKAAININDILSQRLDNLPERKVQANDLFRFCALGPIRSTDFAAQAINSHSFPIELSAKIASTAGNTVCVCFFRDISRRLSAEEAVAHSRDEALAGERAKARFLAVMSHEMRTPLQGIFGTLDLLEETPLSAEQDRHLSILQSSSTLLLNQVNDAVEMLRSGNTNTLVKKDTQFNFCQMMSEVVLSASPTAHKNNSTIKKVPSKRKVGDVEGDQEKLRQVLMNLFTNAAKFTVDGTITVEAARVGEKDSDWVEIQITDTGIGIKPEDLPRIFDEYVRLNEEDTGTPEGSGLGLSITKQLVQLMGGEIGVESEPNEGSVFWVKLPLPAVNQKSAVSSKVGAITPKENNFPQKILLVEDNTSSRVVLEQMLSNEGHNIQSCSDGETAVSYASIQNFDLVIMDINLPGLSGIETAELIRDRASIQNPPRIVFLTALAALEARSYGDKEGKEEIYTKPLRREELRGLVAKKTSKTAVDDRSAHSDFDAQTFHEFRETLDECEFENLLDCFRQEGDDLIARLQDFEGQTPKDLARIIHQLAGSCATFGANAMQAILSRAETAVADEDLITARNELDALPEAWKLACDALDVLQNQASSKQSHFR